MTKQFYIFIFHVNYVFCIVCGLEIYCGSYLISGKFVDAFYQDTKHDRLFIVFNNIFERILRTSMYKNARN